jgi:hypothetical protein
MIQSSLSHAYTSILCLFRQKGDTKSAGEAKKVAKKAEKAVKKAAMKAAPNNKKGALAASAPSTSAGAKVTPTPTPVEVPTSKRNKRPTLKLQPKAAIAFNPNGHVA